MYTVYQIWGQVFVSRNRPSVISLKILKQSARMKESRVCLADSGKLQNEKKTTFCEFPFQAADAANQECLFF